MLAKAARLLGVRVIGTEQNPAGLGPNVDEVRRLCDVTMAKTHFDACDDGLLALLAAGRPHGDPADVGVAGCEAHVCLLQTGLGLLDAGHRLWVVETGCGSRRAGDREAAMRRLQAAGATVVTAEMVVFEWLRGCDHPAFREALALVKAPPAGGLSRPGRTVRPAENGTRPGRECRPKRATTAPVAFFATGVPQPAIVAPPGIAQTVRRFPLPKRSSTWISNIRRA
jgi:hypothetical protein